MNYRIEISPSARQEIRALPAHVRAQAMQLIAVAVLLLIDNLFVLMYFLTSFCRRVAIRSGTVIG